MYRLKQNFSKMLHKAQISADTYNKLDYEHRQMYFLSNINSYNYARETEERVGQIIIMPIPTIEFEQVEELTTTERMEGGYGSTGQ